ncbi:hypothetical protein [Ensifer sp. ZNC0028]|uniref:hypothetical protein n=1 Tax=unclassified Ensifer TaxID=2633371 RepID=UPI0012E05944|nr:hypothetical protein [Ensifer sp. ZNC0028]
MAPWLGRPHRTLFQSAEADAVAYPSFLPERERPVKPDCAIAMSRLRNIVIRSPYRNDSPSWAPVRARAPPSRKPATQDKALNLCRFRSSEACVNSDTATEGFANRAGL